ncbi:hypothetical protein D3C73_817520 [compost metagenome]
MDAGQLGVGHPGGTVMIHLGQHPVDIRFGCGHRRGQHGSRSLRSMEAGDGIQRALIAVHEVISGAAVHMHIDKAGNQQTAVILAALRPAGIGFRQPCRLAGIMDSFRGYGDYALFNKAGRSQYFAVDQLAGG